MLRPFHDYAESMHNRRSIRLHGYDYTQPGAYFVTIVTHDRLPLFGEISDNEMLLNDTGRLVAASWVSIPHHFPCAVMDAFVVMPNHLHGIVIIEDVGRGEASAARSVPDNTRSADASPLQPRPHGTLSGSLAAMVQNFKSVSTRRINASRRTRGVSVWQRNYYEHIIRNDDSLNRVRRYISDNVLRWAVDRENPLMV